jgi:hypothetical protein
VAERWDRERVLALAPDVPSQRTAQSLASGRAWTAAGAAAEADAVWGECRGSASAPYRAVVDLTGPAYRCSCPSRKFPCKHVLALLLLWSEGSVPDDAAGPPDWAGSWLMARAVARGVRGDGSPRSRGVPGGRPPGLARSSSSQVSSSGTAVPMWPTERSRAKTPRPICGASMMPAAISVLIVASRPVEPLLASSTASRNASV